MSNPAIGFDEVVTEPRRLSRANIISYLFIAVGIGLLAMAVINFNNWRRIDPQALAQARVDKEQGLTRAEQTSLYDRQFDAASSTKARYGRSGMLFVILGIVFFWLSRQWPSWRALYGEQMLYAYAFLLPPVGWLLYLVAYPTRGDPNREVIRRNIGIMSLALVGAGLAYFVVSLIQDNVLTPMTLGIAGSEGILAGLVGFLLSPQLAQFIAIAVGGYIALRTQDVRAIAVTAQLVVLAVVLAMLGWLGGNAQQGIEARGLSVSDFSFLDLTAGFDISETLIDYDRTSTYGQAFLAGFLNTLMISVVGIFLASLLGLVVGVARLSTNWLTSTIARAFVELMRNVPLLVILFFLYAGVLLQLPQRDNTIQLLGGRILLNNRGVAIPWLRPTETFAAWYPYLIVGVIIGAVVWFLRNRPIKTTGRPGFSFGYVLLAFLIVPLIGALIANPLRLEIPFIDGLNYAKNRATDNFVGMVMSPPFFGILMGLVLYTGAYIGEVVRAGINSVSKGQREAASALGLSNNQSLQLIILPQALRVIIPPLTNQYLNLAKNSSLAIGIGYADLFFVANTTLNQSGQSVQVFLMIMASYLMISLTISFIMNTINGRIQLKER